MACMVARLVRAALREHALEQSPNHHQPLEDPRTGFQSAPVAQVVPDSGDEPWAVVTDLPYKSWKDACRQIEKTIARRYPQSANKFSLWFAPMPIEAVLRRSGEIRIQFGCTSPRRKEEGSALKTMLEGLLAAEFFTGSQVNIEIVERFEESLPTARTTPAQPVEPQGVELRLEDQPAAPAVVEDPTPPTAAPAAQPTPAVGEMDRDLLEFYRQKTGAALSEDDLRAVLAAIQSVHPAAMENLEAERKRGKGAGDQRGQPAKAAPKMPPPTRLDEILLEPAYATTYDEIVRSHSAIYLPAYFVRHLRHMGASDGLRFMALRQIAYKHGFRDASGSCMLPATINELSRWSTLQPRRIFGGLDDPGSYLFLLAGKVPFFDYYATRPEASRWEDASGFHWKAGGREYCVWKNNGAASNECSQLVPDRFTGEPQWRQSPLVYRVQLSMPLCPEDEEALRSALTAFGVREDPLNAIRQCLALPRSELIPDRPVKLKAVPRKLFTVQELVLETWGRLGDRELTARVAVQARLLENHLLQAERELLKIPFYLLEKWGRYLSPAQLWTAILAMDRVYANGNNGEYRDTTVIHDGIKEMTLWTEDQYSKGAARKITKWLYPFNVNAGDSADKDDDGASEHFNPWFSVFAAEVLPESGVRVKNADNSVQMKLRVLPLVPLSPEDTLRFARKMGLVRLAVRDAAGQTLALEITEEELVVYLPDGRTLRYSYEGELRYGDPAAIMLQVLDRQLSGIEILSSNAFYESQQWPGDLFGRLETLPGALSGRLEKTSDALSGNLEKSAGALFGSLALNPGALFGMLLKLLILNLYGIKINSSSEQPPSTGNLSDNVDALEQFGSRQGQFIQWTEEPSEADWDFTRVVKALGITDVASLREQAVSAEALVSTALELYATPADKFTTSRIAVLVAKLRSSPQPAPGIFQRLVELGPDQLQEMLRRSILNVSPLLNDADWDRTLGRARRDDLIDLAEKLGLARVYRADNHRERT